jgi:hypothetical protein
VVSNRGSVIRNGWAGEFGASLVRLRRGLRGEKLTAASGFMLRLEIGMRCVLLGLGEILNAGVLRLEIWESAEIGNCGSVFGDGARSFVRSAGARCTETLCIRPSSGVAVDAAAQIGDA